MALLQIRVEDSVKQEAGAIYKALGIDLSTAVRMFLIKSIIERGFPFENKLDESALRAILASYVNQMLSEKNGNSEMTLDEINEIIKETRKEAKNIR